MATSNATLNSLETILTFENRDTSQWSVIWSTTQVPGMDTATGGGGARHRVIGRRRLRVSALVLGGLLTMHCRVTASALTGGLFVFMVILTLAVGALANPLRHFEVYLGQWSISGPGRAFRIIPMFDGIGLAICINAIIRAINCCAIAAIAGVYVMHSVADAKLPFTYCRCVAGVGGPLWAIKVDADLHAPYAPKSPHRRNSLKQMLMTSPTRRCAHTNDDCGDFGAYRNFDLQPYDPVQKDVKILRLQEARFSMETGIFHDYDESTIGSTTVGLNPKGWRNITNVNVRAEPRTLAICEEIYSGGYPPLYSTPAYNFFYVEVVQFRSQKSFEKYNIRLCLFIGLVWGIIWLLLIAEKIQYRRLIWNNIAAWFVIIPWIWIALLAITGGCNIAFLKKPIKKVFKVGAKEILANMADALEVALYIHSVSVGTEIIHGKGLNYYASGHIDPQLNAENIWHSVFVLVLSILHSSSAALCALVESVQPDAGNKIRESTLWIIPMYSKCTSLVGYSHLMSTLIFGGLMFSYTTVAFMLIKTALHTIFEYRVKLVFLEQVVVGTLILSCLMLTLIFTTSGGLALLESVDAIMTGVATAFVCLLELGGLLYVYRSRDFMSDMNVATEENACASRISMQWHMIPFVTLATLLMKSRLMFQAELPAFYMWLALAPLLGVLVAVPLRAAHNAYSFLRPAPRRGT